MIAEQPGAPLLETIAIPLIGKILRKEIAQLQTSVVLRGKRRDAAWQQIAVGGDIGGGPWTQATFPGPRGAIGMDAVRGRGRARGA